ncbi:MAG: hypothetical protein CVU40_11135 [Chloroflexi bacterium HGW-Chloroflexi-2]|jgi:hypothetical protein|nr:MAG: hypothetical protein CVU40_11135 [Chloroflexi bacterium HGW-Chloroflexi-2]
MRKIFILLFVLIIAMLQLGIFSNIQILAGKIDLLMLGVIAWIIQKKTELIDIGIYSIITVFFIYLISAESIIIILGLYSLIVIVVYWSKNNIQQLPIISMLIFSAVFTFFHLVIFGFYLQLSGVAMVAEEVFQSVILPSMIINLIAAIPMYLLVNELHRWVYPLAEEA